MSTVVLQKCHGLQICLYIRKHIFWYRHTIKTPTNCESHFIPYRAALLQTICKLWLSISTWWHNFFCMLCLIYRKRPCMNTSPALCMWLPWCWDFRAVLPPPKCIVVWHAQPPSLDWPPCWFIRQAMLMHSPRCPPLHSQTSAHMKPCLQAQTHRVSNPVHRHFCLRALRLPFIFVIVERNFRTSVSCWSISSHMFLNYS